jgi:hypothetical protein
MSIAPQLVHHGIIGVIMSDKECDCDRLTIWVLSGEENLTVKVEVINAHGSIKTNDYQLGSFTFTQILRNFCTETSAIGKGTVLGTQSWAGALTWANVRPKLSTNRNETKTPRCLVSILANFN